MTGEPKVASTVHIVTGTGAERRRVDARDEIHFKRTHYVVKKTWLNTRRTPRATALLLLLRARVSKVRVIADNRSKDLSAEESQRDG